MASQSLKDMDKVAITGNDDEDADMRQGRNGSHGVHGHLNVDGVLVSGTPPPAKDVNQLDSKPIKISLVLINVFHPPVSIGIRY